MTETIARCHWNGEARVTARHLRDCVAAGCEGCEPCTESHCTMTRCSRHLGAHEPLTCARCTGKVRTNLTRIGDLCSLAPIAAIEGGLDSAAVALAGPVPEQSTYAARWHLNVHRRALCRCLDCPDHQPAPAGPACDECAHQTCRRIRNEPACPDLVAWLDYADDDLHPLWVLGMWDEHIAKHLGHTRRNRVTVPSAVSYLKANLTHLAQDPAFAFDKLAHQVHDCLTHVERVLLVAEYVQRGAPCPKCRADGRRAKPLERRYDPEAVDDTADEWACPTCGHTLTLDEYAKSVYVDYLDHADRLTAAQIQAQYRVPESTVRSWAAPTRVSRDGELVTEEPKLKCVGRDASGRKLYPVAVVLQLRDSVSA